MPYPAAHTYMYIDNICEYPPPPLRPLLSLPILTNYRSQDKSLQLSLTNGYRMLVRWYQSH